MNAAPVAEPEDGNPVRLAGTQGEVRAENHLFHLVDTGTPRTGDPDDQPPSPRRDDLATTGEGAVTFNSALSDHYPHVTLEHWPAEPPAPQGAWHGHTRLELTLAGGRLTLFSGVSRLPAPHTLNPPPGHYTLDVWCRRQPAQSRFTTGELIPHGAEQWLLQLWLTTR